MKEQNQQKPANGSSSSSISSKNKNNSNTTIKIDPLRAVTRRIAILRVCFVVCLFAAAALCGYVSFSRISSLEDTVAINTYNSVVSSALENAKAITKRKFKGTDVTATVLRNAFPNASMWPFSALDGYAEIANEIALQSSTLTQALNVVVKPEQVEDFEEFAAKTFQEQGYSKTAGVSDFGFGIFGFKDGKRYHKTTANNTWVGQKHDILVPIFQHNNVNATSILLDVYSKDVQGPVIDSQFDCADEARRSGSKPACSSVTNFVELIIRPGPAALFYKPLFPTNDPYTPVGFVASTLHWEEILYSVVPQYIEGPIIGVVSSETESFSYEIKSGIPKVLGPGWLHDPKYTKLGQGTVLTDFFDTAASSTEYTLTLYPSSEVFSEFQTNSPLAVSLGFVGVIFFCAFVFFAYDFLVKHESHQRKTILEVKRRFVRFISHEIRTPLNTVCMGLEFLKEDMTKQRTQSSPPSKSTTPPFIDDNKLEEWIDLTKDIVDNSTDAVLVLNDLLNYDKIESGTLKLELDEEDLYSRTSHVVSQLEVEAKNRSVHLGFTFENRIPNEMSGDACDNSGDDDIEKRLRGTDINQHHSIKHHRYRALADGTRLSQVLRNITSNALKFTPKEGRVNVKLIYESDVSHVPVSTRPSDKDHIRVGTARLIVQDTGIGMTTEQLKQLYGEGVQFDANKLQAGGGSGLGLWISKGIVESHHGKICAESEGHEKGCTFTIFLPLYLTNHSNHTITASTIGGDTFALSQRSNTASPEVSDIENQHMPAKDDQDDPPQNIAHHVLVAEDSVPNRKMLIRLLERNGHTCSAACDGREAVEAVSSNIKLQDDEDEKSFDVILMDYEMPNLNGPDATKEIRGLGFTGIILGVTGNVLKEDVDFFKQKGANDVLSKPINYGDIESALWRLQQNRRI